MSLNGVLKGFVEGYKTGVAADASRASAALDRERIRKSQPAPDQGTEGGPFGDGATIGTGPGSTDSTTTSSTGGGKVDNDTSQVASRLKADLMKDFKISDIAAGGIVASLAAESGGFKIMQEIGSERYGPNARGGYGYAQWTGPRRTEFEEYAKANNLDINSYEANYGNLKRELQGPEGAILKDLAGAKDYHEATKIFTGSAKEGRGFLRPGDVNLSGRFGWADKVAGVKPFSGTQETGEAGTDTADLAPTKVIDEPTKKGDDALASSQVSVRGGFESPTQTADATGYAPPEELPEFDTMFARRGGVLPEPTTRRFADGGAAEPAFGGFGSLLSGATGGSESSNGSATKAGSGSSGDFGAGFGTGTFSRDAMPVANWFGATGANNATATGAATPTALGMNAVTQAGNEANAANLAAQKEAADAAEAKKT
ncbi:MAG TPA: phage tail tip lysozyme, partial [Pseudoxanthomonas sp.]